MSCSKSRSLGCCTVKSGQNKMQNGITLVILPLEEDVDVRLLPQRESPCSSSAQSNVAHVPWPALHKSRVFHDSLPSQLEACPPHSNRNRHGFSLHSSLISFPLGNGQSPLICPAISEAGQTLQVHSHNLIISPYICIYTVFADYPFVI